MIGILICKYLPMKNYTLTILFSSSCIFCFSQNIDSAQIYFKKGIEEKNSRLFALAGKDLDKAIAFNPNYTNAYIESGNVNLEMRKIDPAMAKFTKAYELDPKNNEIIKQLIYAIFQQPAISKSN